MLAFLNRLLDTHADARPLAAMRILASVVLALASLEALSVLQRLIQPDIVAMPTMIALPRPTETVTMLLAGVWLAAALLLGIGFRARFAAAAIAGCIAYTLALDWQTYSNHLYLFGVLAGLLALAESSAVWSLDARFRGPRPLVAAWPLWLMQVQLSVVYLFAALTKLNGSFLGGEVIRQFLHPAALELASRWIDAQVLLVVFAVATILTEFWLAAGLWLPRFRLATAVIGAGFHAVLVLTGGSVFGQPDPALALFALAMGALYVPFFARRTASTPQTTQSGHQPVADARPFSLP